MSQLKLITAAFEFIDGEDGLPKARNSQYFMQQQKNDVGRVYISKNSVMQTLRNKGKAYDLLGMKVATEAEKRSAGKTLFGAAGGGLLFGGAGAIIGAGLGSMKSDKSTVLMTLRGVESEEIFTVEVKPFMKSSRESFPKFRVEDPEPMPTIHGNSL